MRPKWRGIYSIKNKKDLKKSVNHRHESYHKLIKTKDRKLELQVPRDRNGNFELQMIKKYQSNITKIENKIIGLYGYRLQKLKMGR